jgi:3-oxoacyl-[acyl-carrier protein] reductase
MPKSVAIVTWPRQGIGKATAIRFETDFLALILMARNRVHLEQTAGVVRGAGAR